MMVNYMTEKRFTFEFDGGAWGVPVFYNNNKKLSFDEVVQLLNKLNDENEQLKFELKECREHKLFSRRQLEKENEQLKYTLSAYMVDLNNCKGKCSTLEIENEQLKQSLKNKMESDAYWEQKATERVNKLEKENEELKKDIEILSNLIDGEDKGEKEWWRCNYFDSPLGVPFCTKNMEHCKRNECGDI